MEGFGAAQVLELGFAAAVLALFIKLISRDYPRLLAAHAKELKKVQKRFHRAQRLHSKEWAAMLLAQRAEFRAELKQGRGALSAMSEQVAALSSLIIRHDAKVMGIKPLESSLAEEEGQ